MVNVGVVPWFVSAVFVVVFGTTFLGSLHNVGHGMNVFVEVLMGVGGWVVGGWSLVVGE